MSDLYNRIDALCKERKVNITEMCRASGAPRGSLTDLKMGRTNDLTTATLGKISNYFNVSVDRLLGKEDEKKPADQKASGLRDSKYEMLTTEEKTIVDTLIDSLLNARSKK